MYDSTEGYELNWLPLDSHALRATAYLPVERILYLEFHDGDRYRYFEFTPELFKEFLDAESKGTYFAHKIRNYFDYEQLPKTHHAGG